MVNTNVIFVILSLFFIPSASAHLGAGEDTVIGGYLVDFGYAPPTPNAKESTILAFNLVNDSTKEVIGPTSVWVRISSPENVVFAGTFHPKSEHVSFSYAFPEPGYYEITAKFEKDDRASVQADFELEVTGEKQTKNILNLILLGIIMLIMRLFLGKFIVVFHNKKN